MAEAKLKTKLSTQSVGQFINSISDELQKEDCKLIDALFRELTSEEPKMWGSAIIGYGQEHLVYDSGRELDWMKTGFSPRKGKTTLYILRGGEDNYKDLLDKLGKYSTSKGCLYINKLSDVNVRVLKEILKRSLNN